MVGLKNRQSTSQNESNSKHSEVEWATLEPSVKLTNKKNNQGNSLQCSNVEKIKAQFNDEQTH